MLNLCLSRIHVTKLNTLLKHVKNLHYMKNNNNGLIPFKLKNMHTNLYEFPLTPLVIKKFSTGNTLLKSKDRYKEKKTVVHVNLNEIADIVKVDHMMSQFDDAVENLKNQMIKHLPLRTRTGAVEELTVTFEGEKYNLEELVEINRKPNIVILNASAFPQVIPNILETLTKSQMNLNPQQENTTIYIPLPKVTKEHREGLAKTARQYFVKCKETISDIRNEHVKELKKHENVPIDLIHRGESYINVLQKQYVDKAEQLLKAKQKELLGES